MSDSLNKNLGTTEVLWELNDLYTGVDAKEIDDDLAACQIEAKALHDEFSGRVAELSADQILKVIVRLENLATERGRLSTYAFLNFTTQTQNSQATAFLQKIREENSRISKNTVFFELEWNDLSDSHTAELLNNDILSHYRHYLSSLRRYAPHMLSRDEETLLIEISPVGRGAWTLLFEKVMGHLEFGEKKRTEEEVLADLYHQDQTVRQQAARDLTDGLNSQLHVLTHITNTLLADKMIDDRLRKYPAWVSSMNLYNELEDKTVNTLIDTVVSRYDIPKRYYHLKKKILGLKELSDYDRYAPLPDLPSTVVSWKDCRKMVIDSFTEFSSELGEIAQLFFDKNWIHAPIIPGKRGGAFAHPCTPDVHPYLMINYTGNLRDVSTVAHEMGHGIHQYLSAKLGYLNSDTTLVLAETASVFAELLLFKKQLTLLHNHDQKIAFISQKLESIFATVFRQIAMNRFEELSHTGRRQHGELSAEQLGEYWIQTQQEMFADSVILTKDYSTWWSYIPHFLSTPGYVYSYAFGELLVLALYNIYRKDTEWFVPKYIELLKSGGSSTPYALVEPFGIDLNSSDFWQGGLEVIDDMLKDIEL
nr:M3 family oligoendopeptidase [Desulfobulbaceae bacterium]